MKSKIGPIPLALVGIFVAIAVIVDVPMVLLHSVTMQHLAQINQEVNNTSLQVQKVEYLVMPTSTATPSATPTPTKAPVFRSVTPVTPSVK